MSVNTNAQYQTTPLAQDREAAISQMAEHVAKVDKEYPEANIKAKGDWWMPSINFGFDVKGLPAGTQEKLNACFQRLIDQKYAPEVVDSSLDEARGYLAGHEDLLERFDKIFGNRGIWDVMYKHELEKN